VSRDESSAVRAQVQLERLLKDISPVTDQVP
jgi:hypothetical protein